MSDETRIGDGPDTPVNHGEVSPLAEDVEIDSFRLPLGPRSEYIANYVGDRIEGWIRTNTHSSPQGTSKPGVPSRQHLETWERMANEEADKMRLSDETIAPSAQENVK